MVTAFPKHSERLPAAQLDRARATPADITALDLFCVIDAAGPFQGQTLDFARAVIEAGAHYVDLADARDFVAAFDTLHAAAQARGVLAVTGASSTPALTHAVIDDMTRGWTRIDGVEAAISPGNRANPLGLSVFQSILSYVGRPVRVWRHGRWAMHPGWGLTVRRRMGDLGLRWQSLVETPDLDLVPQRFPSVRNAIFRAGLELGFQHVALLALSFLVRAGLLKSLAPFAEPLRDAAKLLRGFGSDCGGMTVDVIGVYADGARLQTTWTLIAESGDGPKIPTLPALAIVRRLLDGRLVRRGAGACVGILDLAAIEEEFSRYDIRSARETRTLESAPLFVRQMPDFDAMPAAVRDVHACDAAAELQGRVDIEGAKNAAARLIAWFAGFPGAAHDLPASVTVEREGDGEVWIRRFGESEFLSHLGAGATRGTLTERFGPLTFDLDAASDARGFALTITRGRIGTFPLPGFLTPSTSAGAAVDEHGRYRFDVTIALPFFGRLVGYRGWLEPASTSSSDARLLQ